MGRKIANIYGKLPLERMTLEIISNGYYSLEVVFAERHYLRMSEFTWCFESTKGLVYTSDLTLKLPKAMGYSTARVYLRDFIPYIEGASKACAWIRKDMHDYCWPAK